MKVDYKGRARKTIDIVKQAENSAQIGNMRIFCESPFLGGIAALERGRLRPLSMALA